MLVEVIGDLLPSAVGVALSPLPVIAITLMLGAPRARSQGLAFALGWVAGLALVSAVVVLVAGSGDPGGKPSTVLSWLEILIAVLFLVMAARQWASRPQPGVEPEPPKWMAAIDTLSTGRTVLIGAALSGLNPKNLALTLAAAATIAHTDLSGGSTVAALAVFVAVGSVTVAGPVVYYLVAPRRAAAPLRSIKDTMSTHNAVIMMIVLLLLGTKLLGNGLAGL